MGRSPRVGKTGKKTEAASSSSAPKKARTPRKGAVSAAPKVTGVEVRADAGSLASLSHTVTHSVDVAVGTLSTVATDQTLSATAEVSDPRQEIMRRLDEIAHLVGQIMPLPPEAEREFARIFAEKDSGRLGNLAAGRAPSETFQITIEQTSFAVSSLRHELESGNGFQDTLRLLDVVFKRSAQAIEWWADILHKVSGDFKTIMGSLAKFLTALAAVLTALHFLIK